MSKYKFLLPNTYQLLFMLALAALSWILGFDNLLHSAGKRLDFESPIPIAQGILILWWLLLLLMVSDLVFRKKVSVFAMPAIYAFTFFTGDDALWASELVWHGNHWMVILPPLLFVGLCAVVIYRIDPKLSWLYGKTAGQDQAKSWKGQSFANKLFAIGGLVAGFALAMYVPYKVNLTIGYLSADQPVSLQARVTGSGSTRGKYFYHRYWRIEISAHEEKFWVYAAAKTQPLEAHTCSTSPDPEPGLVLEIEARKGLYGLCYDRVIQIKGPDGIVICD